MINHRWYTFVRTEQIMIARDLGITKAQQIIQITEQYKVVPRYSGKTQKFYV